jgi:hypothetical protein
MTAGWAWRSNTRRATGFAWVIGALLLSLTVAGCNPQSGPRQPRLALFVGVDASGSFRGSGYYDNALSFLAHYIYGHLNELGGLAQPRELFVGSIGGKDRNEPKAFHPIHDFAGKTIEQIEADLREWFPPTDTMTDFNSFFQQVARIAKERNLILAPITLMVVSDGVPDAGGRGASAGSESPYSRIDLSSLEYLSRNLTLRLAYANPKVGESWRKHVPHQRVRLWTVDAEVMKGWTEQLQPGVAIDQQDRLWKWVRDNVDYRVRSTAA